MVRSKNKTLRAKEREENKEGDGRFLYTLWAKIQTGSVFWPQSDKLRFEPRILGQPRSGPRSISRSGPSDSVVARTRSASWPLHGRAVTVLLCSLRAFE